MAEQFLTQTQDQRLQQILAPQLRQSLEMLQVPALELQALIQQELERNPTLEEQPIEVTPVEVEPGSKEPEDTPEMDLKEEFEVLARLDDEWREYFQQNQVVQPYSQDDVAKRQFFLDSLSQSQSLQEHLLSQLQLSALSADDQKAGELIIGSINDDGYLSTSIEDLTQTTGFEMSSLLSVLDVIQEFDPIGVGSRNLEECLLLQLRRLGKEDSLAATIVRHHLDELAARKYALIAKALKIPAQEVQEIAYFISTLEPKPGRVFTSESPAYVTPEVTVQKVDDKYIVILNREHIPHVRISKQYRQLMENPSTTQEVKNYIREKIRAGAFLIKSIHQRQQTIFQIATEIVKVQRDFFDHGLSHLKPLTMSEVAQVLDIHETTVSRALAGKYMQTPRGTYEMKYFFTPGFKRTDGKEISNKTIKDTIIRMISDENPSEPLSDQAVVEKLQEQGITVARRTIAKYRDELRILPSHLRKSM